MPCPICTWRRRCIRNKEGDDVSFPDTPPNECDSSHPLVLSLLHFYPGKVWTDVIDTGHLCHAEPPIPRWDGRLWVRIPLRGMATDLSPSDRHYYLVEEVANQPCGILCLTLFLFVQAMQKHEMMWNTGNPIRKVFSFTKVRWNDYDRQVVSHFCCDIISSFPH